MNTNPNESELIDKVLQSGLIPYSHSQRLRVIRSLFFQGRRRSQTKRELGVSFPFVDRWRDRWKAMAEKRQHYFSAENQAHRGPKADREFLLSIVSDLPRSGTPAKFSESVKNRIIAISLEKPSELGVPIERWSHELLAKYLIEQNIVETISSTTVGDFLKSAPLKSSQE